MVAATDREAVTLEGFGQALLTAPQTVPGRGRGWQSVCSIRKLVRVTRVRPSSATPPTLWVASKGSPEKRASGVRRKRTIRSLITNWSTSSWGCVFGQAAGGAARSRSR